MLIKMVNAFLSHSDEDKVLAGKLKKELDDYGIDAFVAHDDLMAGQNWMSALTREIRHCDLFLVLLSKNYHLAHYIDHELGVAYCLKKPIIPISVDGTKPYGFMPKYQSENASNGLTPEAIEKLAHTIYITLGEGPDVIDLIEIFSDSDSYVSANKRARMLFEYKELLNKF
ncbi:MAG: toll/interleukin-1 receptor domain-containing protein [Nitrososphaera sp.]